MKKENKQMLKGHPLLSRSLTLSQSRTIYGDDLIEEHFIF